MRVKALVALLYPPGTQERPASPTSPYKRLGQMIFEDRTDLLLILVYTFFSGLFALSLPLATQIVVNTIAAGVYLQPLSVIAGTLLAGLTFVALLRLITLWIVERIRQRTFARVALRLAYRLPRIKHSAMAKEYLPELVNRFFDTITVQSGWFTLLLDAPAAILQVLIGLTLLAIYSPWLLLFDAAVIVFFLLEVFVLGFGGYKTRSNETTQRFRIAQWLEEIARCKSGIKSNGIPPFIINQADRLLVDYVKLRQTHFKVLFRQSTALFFFQSLASASVLGFGGWLVINRQLTMGQLVASLLIVNIMMPALERLVRNMQNVYELLSALGKIGYVEDLPLDKEGGESIGKNERGARIDIRGLHFAFQGGEDVLRGVDMSVAAGEQISLFGPNGSGKTTIAEILSGLLEPGSGLVQINGIDVRDADLVSLRQNVALMSDANEILPGTILDNVSLRRPDISYDDVLWALDMVQFTHESRSLPNGLQTEIFSGGRNLSRGQIQKILLARCIAKRPQLLILDEAFTAIEESAKVDIMDRIYSKEVPWTIIDISHDADSILRSQKIFLLEEGKIVESGPSREMISKVGGKLEQLFPQLVPILRILDKHSTKSRSDNEK
ncbi:MAG: ATP-binding cassette domain-containing protein [Candidatus Obscuribacter sp.]|nr:ATP-binding cassette domain-containing protein [Candidatus Obscuribacter sp.]MBP6351021.1 ATP-binding cassette domain-containing protein [Candidatus Obscuribacter sp.]MBP6595871.1 ATP-binding cassette domain-containing protein [Candidatus Obscuribacter sp.]